MTKTTPPESAPDDEIVEPSEEVTVEAGNEDSQGPTEPDEIESVEEKVAPNDNVVPVRQKSGLSVLLGGAAAAVLGFGVAQIVPNGWPLGNSDMTEIETKISAQDADIQALNETIESLQVVLDSKADGERQVLEFQALSQLIAKSDGDLGAEFEALNGNLTQLSERLTVLEKRPISENNASAAAATAYERELAELREEMAAQKADIESATKEAEEKLAAAKIEAESLQAGAAATANAALLRASMVRIDAAIEGGGPFEVALSELSEAIGSEANAQLQAVAKSGVLTLSDLRKSFPEAARAALSAEPANDQSGNSMDRLGAFLRSQTGARSLSPQEGDSLDAVLSRAEALVGDGDLENALVEISTLPPASQEVMASWVESAVRRIETQAAIKVFASSISDK